MREVLLLVCAAVCSCGAEEVIFPPGARVIDVTQAPYHAKGDGVADDTRAIAAALAAHPNQGAIIYLPKGTYLISDTLKWPHGDRGGMEEKNTILQGQSRDGSVIRLRDQAPTFDNPKRRKGLLWTGELPAQRFRNAVRNLTLETGKGNPGAVGMQFMANNQGGVFDVCIRSGDGQGPIGLDLSYSDEQGPCLIKNVEVIGFDIGIHTAFSVNSVTMEHIQLSGQKRFGLRNDGQVVSVRALKSMNRVPAVFNGPGSSLLTLVDCMLKGHGGRGSAIENEGALFIRDLKTSGYAQPLENRVEPRRVMPKEATEFTSLPPLTLFNEQPRSLRLPIRETPELPWDPLQDWASPADFGGRPDDDKLDAAPAIQQAIDSGKTTVYLPRGTWWIGKTLQLRGDVRRLIGCEGRLALMPALESGTNPVIRVMDGSAPVVLIERIRGGYEDGPFARVEHASRRTLVLRNMTMGNGLYAYVNTGGGDLFVEDVVGGNWVFQNGQHVWARQLNVENEGTHVLNNGATLWILGYKTERGGTLIDTLNGGRTEVLGGFVYATSGTRTEPVFRLQNSAGSFVFRESAFSRKPFDIVVTEIRGGETRHLRKDDVPRATNGALVNLFSNQESNTVQ